MSCHSYRDKYPLNMYLLGTWTFVEAYTVGVVCAAYASQGQVGFGFGSGGGCLSVGPRYSPISCCGCCCGCCCYRECWVLV